VLSHREDREYDHYAFVTADATPGYGAKAEKVQRSFVFLKKFDLNRLEGRPPKAAFVIYDRVVSRNPDHQKVWLFHSLEEPTIYGPKDFSVQNSGANYGGFLLSLSLLPRQARIEKIGGPGKEFWVNNTNYATTKVGTCEAGAWRVEVTSQEPGKEVEFLHVFLVDPRRTDRSILDAQLVEGRGAVGVEVFERTVVFSTGQEPARSLSYISNGTGDREHLVIGLPPGKMARVNVNGNTLVRFETGESGSMRFSAVQTGKAEFEIVVE